MPGQPRRFPTTPAASDLLAAILLDGVFKQETITMDASTVACAAGLAVREAENLPARSAERPALNEDIAQCIDGPGYQAMRWSNC